MNHRIVTAVVTGILALFVAAIALFASTASSIAPAKTEAGAPANPHPPSEETEACGDCHAVEQDSIPATHRSFTLKTCGSCHIPSKAVRVPHSIAMGSSRCPLCHGEPARDFGMPKGHLLYETDECLLCHPVSSQKADIEPAAAGLSKSPAVSRPHASDGVFEDCDYCHHVEAKSTLPENHRVFGLDTCAECHDGDQTE
jgi:cytochrome c553